MEWISSIVVAILSFFGALASVALNNWLSNRAKRKLAFRQERLEAYRTLLTLMYVSLANTPKTPGTDLTYDELCGCYCNFYFWSALGNVQLLAPKNIQQTCGELHRVLGKQTVVTKERLLELFAILHQQMIDDVNETLSEKKRF